MHTHTHTQGIFDRKRVHEEVISMVKDIQLIEKKDIQAGRLSGGMKRKLRYCYYNVRYL